jgi:hypothetical protein
MAEHRPEPHGPREERIAADARAELEKLAKWRSVFAGWQLGTRLDSDPESQAVRDHREVTILLRAELSALTGLLIDKGVFTAAEFTQRVGEEARLLSEDYSRRFPGMEATEHGIAYDLETIRRRGTMEGWPP